eukprot:scaffold582122_cov50-Prasinocladus_malaysianus.AAC.1
MALRELNMTQLVSTGPCLAGALSEYSAGCDRVWGDGLCGRLCMLLVHKAKPLMGLMQAPGRGIMAAKRHRQAQGTSCAVL